MMAKSRDTAILLSSVHMNTPKQQRPRKAVAYVRLSSLREGSNSVSPEEQAKSCAAYAAAQGWEIVDTIYDLDVSGSAKGLRLDRPGLARVRALLPEVDVVIVRSLDRLARNVVDFGRLAEEAESHGAALVSVKEGLDLSTPSGRFVASILSAFAQMEAETIAARVADGRAGLAAQHRYGGGNPGFGYRSAPHPSGKGRTLVPDPEEAATLRRAADLILSGKSLHATGRILDREGRRPRSAPGWTTTSLRNALTGNHVLGYLTHRGEVVRDSDGLPVQAFPPLLPHEDVERLRALLLKPKGAAKRRTKASLLLSGLAFCAECGKPLYASWSTRKIKGESTKVDTMRCAYGPCNAVTIKRDHIEEYVVEEFLKRYSFFTVVEAVEHSRDNAELARVEEAIRFTANAMTAPGADIPALAARMSELSARRDALAEEGPEVTVEFVDTGKTFGQAYEEADLDGRRRLLGEVIERIVVGRGVRGRKGRDDSRVTIHWRGEEPL